MSPLLQSLASPAGRRRLLLFAALLLALWASWRVGSDEGVAKMELDKPTATPMRGTINRSAESNTPFAWNLDWPVRAQQRQAVPDIFASERPLLPQGKAATVVASAPAPAVTPSLPFGYKFMGRLSDNTGNNIFLVDSKDHLIQTKVGQTLAGGWVLTSIEDKRLLFRHSDSGEEKIIPIGMH